jgi:subtilisin family serine protease
MITKRFTLYIFFFLISLFININAQSVKAAANIFQNAGLSDVQLQKADALTRSLIYNHLTDNLNVLKKYKAVENSPVITFNKNQFFAAVFLKSYSPGQTKIQIEKLGGKVTSIIKDILVAEIPVNRLTDIIFENQVLQVEAAKYTSSLLDTSLTFINADKVHAGEGLPKPYKGEGVIVGVLDSGIDWTHPAFSNENGNRILYLWDMSGDTNPPAEFDFGTEYTKDDLDQSNSNQIDDNGHGTHVASTAAGSANGEEYPLAGVAPEADIIFVKGFRAGQHYFGDNDVINGCDYIMKRAEELGKPVVINLSLGSVTGNTGNSLYEEALTNLVEPGKLIVASAGNSGSSTIHLQYQMSGNSVEEDSETYWQVSDSTQGQTAIFGYPKSNDFNVGVKVYSGDYAQVFYTSESVGYNESFQNAPIIVNNDTLGNLSIDGRPTSIEPHYFFVNLTYDTDTDIDDYVFSIYTFGSAEFNAWIANGTFSPNNGPGDNIFAGDNLMTVGSPSTAYNVFSIGAFTTKTSWTNINGDPFSVNGTLTDRAYFSSMGPTRDGRIKPDFSAPGHWIAAGYSKDANYSSAQIINDKTVVLQGTSMSAPHFTGVVALLLEQDPDLTYDEAFEVLMNSSITDDITGSVPNNEFGYGRIDVQAALQELITDVQKEDDVPVAYSLKQNYPNPFNPSTTIEYSLPDNELVKIKVYDVLGNEITTLVNDIQSAGTYKVSFDAKNLSTGVYFYRISAGNFQEIRKMIFLK